MWNVRAACGGLTGNSVEIASVSGGDQKAVTGGVSQIAGVTNNDDSQPRVARSAAELMRPGAGAGIEG
jgi:hypothetical protein